MPPKAASILRNRKGVGEAELGLANEMAINQFIAHHSVISNPRKNGCGYPPLPGNAASTWHTT